MDKYRNKVDYLKLQISRMEMERTSLSAQVTPQSTKRVGKIQTNLISKQMGVNTLKGELREKGHKIKELEKTSTPLVQRLHNIHSAKVIETSWTRIWKEIKEWEYKNAKLIE